MKDKDKPQFNIIDRKNWERETYFNHYATLFPNVYSLTVNIDITDLLWYLKQNKIKFYPTLIYLITKQANRRKEFRFAFSEDGQLGYWSKVIPNYIIFNQVNNLHTGIHTAWSNTFREFYSSYEADTAKYLAMDDIKVEHCDVQNTIFITCLPWASFTALNFNEPLDKVNLRPVFTIGRYFEQGSRVLMPLALQLHHAVCDGFHASRFVSELQELAINYPKWINEK